MAYQGWSLGWIMRASSLLLHTSALIQVQGQYKLETVIGEQSVSYKDLVSPRQWVLSKLYPRPPLSPFLWWPTSKSLSDDLLQCSVNWSGVHFGQGRGREGEKKSSGSRVGMIYDYCKQWSQKVWYSFSFSRSPASVVVVIVLRPFLVSVAACRSITQ